MIFATESWMPSSVSLRQPMSAARPFLAGSRLLCCSHLLLADIGCRVQRECS